jgi:uncharacterized membrane protein YdjX (TVP38/TMEM64 family)
VAIWLGLIAAYWLYTNANQITPLETIERLVGFLADNPAGVLIYIGCYLIRPLLFFPATLFTLAGGYLFGPVWGVVIVMVAGNLSASVAYLVGRFLGKGALNDSSSMGVLQGYAERMRRNSFETVLIMRFLFLPFDLVSYFSGFLRVNWAAFILATALGSIPGTVSFVLFGAAFEGGLTGAPPSLEPASLLLAAAMFMISLGLSRWFRRAEARRTEAQRVEAQRVEAQRPA